MDSNNFSKYLSISDLIELIKDGVLEDMSYDQWSDKLSDVTIEEEEVMDVINFIFNEMISLRDDKNVDKALYFLHKHTNGITKYSFEKKRGRISARKAFALAYLNNRQDIIEILDPLNRLDYKSRYYGYYGDIKKILRNFNEIIKDTLASIEVLSGSLRGGKADITLMLMREGKISPDLYHIQDYIYGGDNNVGFYSFFFSKIKNKNIKGYILKGLAQAESDKMIDFILNKYEFSKPDQTYLLRNFIENKIHFGVKKLIEKGYDNYNFGLLSSSSVNNEKMINYFIDLGATNIEESFVVFMKEGYTMLDDAFNTFSQYFSHEKRNELMEQANYFE